MMLMIHETAKIYRDADIYNSEVNKEVTIGEFSRVKNSFLDDYCYIDRQNVLLNVKLGKRTYTGPWCMMFHCSIGSYCSISYGVTIGPPEHKYNRISTHPFIYDSKFGLAGEDQNIRNEKFANTLEIGNDVWIGCNSTILRGIKIGDGAIIGANAVVTKDVPPYAIVAGVPAKVIKYRFSKEIVTKLLEMKWWKWEDEKIQANLHLFKSNVTNIDIISILR